MNQNNIGTRGENFAACMITQFNIFRECFLGDKFPVSDSIYEITDEITPYPFFLQVKSTEAKTGRYNKRNKYLKTPIAHEKYLKLTNRPIPTYIAGVDLEEMKVYIAPAFSNNLKYPSIPTKFVLSAINDKTTKKQNQNNLIQLREDIINYWGTINANILHYKHNFNSNI